MTIRDDGNATQDAARAFAYAAHLGQAYGEANYITHLDHAVDVLRRFGIHTARYEIYQATYLHDTIEDTAATYEDLYAVFGPEVATLVAAVSDRPGKNRKEKHERTYPFIRAAGEDAVIVKLADRIANVETSARGPNRGKLAMYRREHKDFRAALWSPEQSAGAQAMWKHLDLVLGHKP